jgi:hypothetical protein
MYNNILDYVGVSRILAELKRGNITLNEFSLDNSRIFQKAVKRLVIELSEKFNCLADDFKVEHILCTFSAEKNVHILKVKFNMVCEGLTEYFVINPASEFFEAYSVDSDTIKHYISESLQGIEDAGGNTPGSENNLLINDIMGVGEPNTLPTTEFEEDYVLDTVEYSDKATDVLKKRFVIEYTKDPVSRLFTIDRILFMKDSVIDIIESIKTSFTDSQREEQKNALTAICGANVFYEGINNLIKVIDRKKYLDIWYLKTEELQPEAAREKHADMYNDSDLYFMFKMDQENTFVLYEDFDIETGKSLGVMGVMNPDDNRLLLVACDEATPEDIHYTTYVEAEYYLESVVESVKKTINNATEVPAKVISTAKGFVGKFKTTVRKINDAKSDDEREDILNNEYFPLISTVFHWICVPGIIIFLAKIGMINPLLGLIIGGAQIIYKNTEDKRRKMDAVASLRTELEILDESINDAKGDNDRQARNQLMRVKRVLEARIAKIGGIKNI